MNIHAEYPVPDSLDRVFYVKEARNYQNYIDNDTAVCFLVKARGRTVCTNMSAAGGD